jgi:CHAT domain-containing protein
VYPLDVAAPPPAAETGRVAALVADARGDLAAAGVEAEAVAARLRAAGFQVADDLRGRAADAAHVRALLGRADLLHYAGHGELAGRDGFESALLLAGEDRLGVGELLLLPRVPAYVVVSACESGRAPVADKLAVEGLGVAQALVLAGSRQVIATTRPVADAAARRLMEAVYAQLRPGEPVDLAAALATAQRAASTADAAGDWAAFRVLVP